MPELPEVETTVLGLTPHIQQQPIKQLQFMRDNLRYPLEKTWIKQIQGQTIQRVSRRAKYICMTLDEGVLLWHLGMSGSMRIEENPISTQKHDHIYCQLGNAKTLCYNDPRRFGFLKYFKQLDDFSAYFKNYGIEPLAKAFNGAYLWQLSQDKSQPIKTLLMNQQYIVGVGNIYAAEALFYAKIHPKTPANQLTKAQATRLVKQIKAVLQAAIAAGGTTLKDFSNAENKPGYFQQSLAVYGQSFCPVCQSEIGSFRLAGRNTFYCPRCQKR